MLSTTAKATELVNRMKELAGANLQSVILYGSAARGDFHAERSDLNLLCVFTSLHVEELARLSPVVRWWCEEMREPAPLLFTKEELENSADVFPIEFLDIQSAHRLLFGSDVIGGIEVPMNLHRVQVEHDLRTVILKLRQHYLRESRKSADLIPVLRKSFSGVLVLLRHAILAFGEEPPAAAGDVLIRAAALCGANSAALDSLLRLRDTGQLQGDLLPVYGAYLNALDKIVASLDKHIPKQQWRRVKNAAH